MIVCTGPACEYWRAALGLRRARGVRQRFIRILNRLATKSDRVGLRARALLHSLPEAELASALAGATQSPETVVVQRPYKGVLIEAVIEQRADGKWGAAVAVYIADGAKTRLCWVPTIARYYETRERAEAAALKVGTDHAERHWIKPQP